MFPHAPSRRPPGEVHHHEPRQPRRVRRAKKLKKNATIAMFSRRESGRVRSKVAKTTRYIGERRRGTARERGTGRTLRGLQVTRARRACLAFVSKAAFRVPAGVGIFVSTGSRGIVVLRLLGPPAPPFSSSPNAPGWKTQSINPSRSLHRLRVLPRASLVEPVGFGASSRVPHPRTRAPLYVTEHAAASDGARIVLEAGRTASSSCSASSFLTLTKTS